MLMTKVFDAEDVILGRLATSVAQELLKGESVAIVNAEKAVVTGNPTTVFARYRRRRELKGPMSQSKGPFYPKRPDRIVRRTVRGMIPFKNSAGREAYKRCMAYVGIPKEFEGEEMIVLDAKVKLPRSKYVYVSEISKNLGGKF
ncbi:MAG: 50S ribosomal protein L13 [Candidatus Thermoplasmatota archaeon]|nr:50S ribosomal protein L13 [Candidatus Thermoplasmatota archaeon]